MAQIWCSNLVLRHQCPHWMIFQTQTAVATGADREWKHDMSAPDDLCILECNCCVWKKKTTNFVEQRFQSWTILTRTWNLTLDVFLELFPTYNFFCVAILVLGGMRTNFFVDLFVCFFKKYVQYITERKQPGGKYNWWQAVLFSIVL